MARIFFQREGDWVRLLGPTSRPFIEFLKYGIKPQTMRRYDGDSRAWLVHWKQLRTLANTARRFYEAVDWSTLPPEWQMVAAGGEATTTVVEEPEEKENPFTVLHLTEDAPLEVIIAAYRALAQLHHPDHGGSDEAMARINDAYTSARATREH
jgi:hypothetical protein